MKTTDYLISDDRVFQSILDDEDAYVCPMPRLQELVDASPDAYTQGFLSGVFSLRKQLEVITGRSC